MNRNKRPLYPERDNEKVKRDRGRKSKRKRKCLYKNIKFHQTMPQKRSVSYILRKKSLGRCM